MSEDVYENYRENMKNTIMRNNSYSDEMKYSQGILKQLNEAKEKLFELEQQLKTAKQTAFISGFKFCMANEATNPTAIDVNYQAERYASKLEQGEG